MARIVKNLRLLQETARNCAVAWNWRQNALHNRCFSWNLRRVLRRKSRAKQSANSKFTLIGLLGQKRADILKFAIFVQNSPRDYELLEISVFCQKGKENNNMTKYSHFSPKASAKKSAQR